MNWTGGRLHRHAKSNNNAELKAQRQHFARVSLNKLVAARSEAPNRSTDPSVASLCDAELRNRCASDIPVQGYSPYETHFHGSCSTQPLPHTLILLQWSGICADCDAASTDHQSSKREIATRPDGDYDSRDSDDNLAISPKASRREHRRIKSNSMNEMRNELLGRPDWLSLSLCRPLEIQFSSAGDVANVGRHRKHTKVDDHATANTQSDSSYHFPVKVLGKRKRSVEQCDSSEVPQQYRDHASSQRMSSFLDSMVPASSPPKNTERSCSTKLSDANTNLSLPPILLSDPDRITYELIDDEADAVDFAGELVPLDMARNMESFDNVQEKYLSSRSGRRNGIDHGTSRVSVDLDTFRSSSQSKSKLVSPILGSETVAQELVMKRQPSEWNGRPLELVDRGSTVSAQRERYQDRYQLNGGFPVVAYADAKLPHHGGSHAMEGRVAASRKMSLSFPRLAGNEAGVSGYTLDVADGSHSDRRYTCTPNIARNRSRACGSERQHAAISPSSAMLNNNQLHSSEIRSQYQHPAVNSTRRFELDKEFDHSTEPCAMLTKSPTMTESPTASQYFSSVLDAYSPNITSRQLTFSTSERPTSGTNRSHRARDLFLPAHQRTKTLKAGFEDSDNASATVPRDEHLTQSFQGNNRADGEASAIFARSPAGARQMFVVNLSSSPTSSDKYVLTDGSRGGVPLRLVKHNRGAVGYGKYDGVPSHERTPRRAAHRGDTQSGIFSTPERNAAKFDLHPSENHFPLLYSDRSR